MRWFFPSWNGDVRLESDGTACSVLVIEPTPREQQLLVTLAEKLVEKQFLEPGTALWKTGDAYREKKQQRTLLAAPIAKVAPLFTKVLKAGKQTLTAVSFQDGKIETVHTDEVPPALAERAEKEGKAAAAVKRPTPSCPACQPGAVGPASEVLLAFLDEDEHRTWSEERCIVVEGGLTGHRYVLAHRHTERAARIGRICYDLDSDVVVHFHDNSVPPEEEVLAAKLVLEHREAWLRNEATVFGVDRRNDMIFKNPFGDVLDGTTDANIPNFIGGFALGLEAMR